MIAELFERAALAPREFEQVREGDAVADASIDGHGVIEGRGAGGVDAALLGRVLSERFGFGALRGPQVGVVSRLLGFGGDAGGALVVLPTGGGKSLCYQLPALALRAAAQERGEAPGIGLVLSPLIALMEDQVSALRGKGVRAAYINSTLSKKKREAVQAEIRTGEVELLYVTPERMNKPAFREALAGVPGGVRLLAVDEAHCISKWGHDLRPAYAEVGRFRRELGDPLTVALTATATGAVREDIRAVLGLDEASMPLFATGIDRPNLKLTAKETFGDLDKLDEVVRSAKEFGGTQIAYFALIKDLERFADDALRALAGIADVGVYHGRLDGREKKRVYGRFMESGPGDPLVLLATNAFGMGVDKADIRAITHCQVPGSVEAYYQEVGRAGRDGEPSRCVLCYDQSDLAVQQQFVEWQNPSADLLVQVMSAVEARYAGGGAGHAAFDADDLRLDVIGKGHAHGRGGGTIEYALITLEKLGAIESVGMGRYAFVRVPDDAEIDAGEIDEKKKRDLTRLLEVVKMARSGDVRGHVLGYFDLPRGDLG